MKKKYIKPELEELIDTEQVELLKSSSSEWNDVGNFGFGDDDDDDRDGDDNWDHDWSWGND